MKRRNAVLGQDKANARIYDAFTPFIEKYYNSRECILEIDGCKYDFLLICYALIAVCDTEFSILEKSLDKLIDRHDMERLKDFIRKYDTNRSISRVEPEQGEHKLSEFRIDPEVFHYSVIVGPCSNSIYYGYIANLLNNPKLVTYFAVEAFNLAITNLSSSTSISKVLCNPVSLLTLFISYVVQRFSVEGLLLSGWLKVEENESLAEYITRACGYENLDMSELNKVLPVKFDTFGEFATSYLQGVSVYASDFPTYAYLDAFVALFKARQNIQGFAEEDIKWLLGSLNKPVNELVNQICTGAYDEAMHEDYLAAIGCNSLYAGTDVSGVACKSQRLVSARYNRGTLDLFVIKHNWEKSSADIRYNVSLMAVIADLNARINLNKIVNRCDKKFENESNIVMQKYETLLEKRKVTDQKFDELRKKYKAASTELSEAKLALKHKSNALEKLQQKIASMPMDVNERLQQVSCEVESKTKTIEDLSTEIRELESVIRIQNKKNKQLLEDNERLKDLLYHKDVQLDKMSSNFEATHVMSELSNIGIDRYVQSICDYDIVVIGGDVLHTDLRDAGFKNIRFVKAGARTMDASLIANADLVVVLTSYLDHCTSGYAVDLAKKYSVNLYRTDSLKFDSVVLGMFNAIMDKQAVAL